ncbi:hypothetical protein ILUMI_18260, partial [Ignelater luminosus]
MTTNEGSGSEDVKTPSIISEEIHKAVKAMKNGKAPGPGRRNVITRRQLFNVLQEKGRFYPTNEESQSLLLNYIKDIIGLQNVRDNDRKDLEKAIKSFGNVLHQKWKQCYRSQVRFDSKTKQWLDEGLIMRGKEESASLELGIRGRPKVHFSEASDKTKRRRWNNVVKTMKEALAPLLDLKLTRHQYITLRYAFKQKKLKTVLPSYNNVIKAKRKCYPDEQSIVVTDNSAELNLQPLLDHTVSRIAQMQENVLLSCKNECAELDLKMIYKWGSESSGSHSSYKHKVENEKKKTQ